MIISRTPFRISFFGGGTDYPTWYEKNGGAVLSAAIDKYCYISLRYLPPFFEHKFRVIYTDIENRMSADEIKHPAVRAVLQYFKQELGLEIHHDADLPARSGMGSSSSFVVGMLNAMYALNGKISSKRRLANEAVFIEQVSLKETVGCQDQIMAAYGGVNHVVISRDGDFIVTPLAVGREVLNELNLHLMLFYTGIKRTASEVASTYVCDLLQKEKQLFAMGDMVKEGISVLNSGRSLERFGSLLNESWLLKRGLSAAVSNDYIDEIYDAAKSSGAIGGKITGAGGGGFLLLFAKPVFHDRIKERLKKLVYVPIHFDFLGSQIIFIDN